MLYFTILIVKEGTLRAHVAIGFEENTGTYLNNKYIPGSLPCAGSPETGAACRTIANWLKMFVFFFLFCVFFPRSLVPFGFYPDRKHIIYLMRPYCRVSLITLVGGDNLDFQKLDGAPPIPCSTMKNINNKVLSWLILTPWGSINWANGQLWHMM